jgi:hypothetical protein
VALNSKFRAILKIFRGIGNNHTLDIKEVLLDNDISNQEKLRGTSTQNPTWLKKL